MISTLGLLLALAAGQTPQACLPQPSSAGAPDAVVCAPDDAALRQRIDAYLGVIDRPISAEAWRSLGPRAVPILVAIVNAPDERAWRKANALAALATIGGPEAEATVVAQAHETRSPWSVRVSAVRGAGYLLGAERVAGELRPVLERDPDRRVRAAAAEALTRRSGSAGCAAVKAQAAREPAEVRGMYRRALKVCVP
jgi:HEAT repeat protein